MEKTCKSALLKSVALRIIIHDGAEQLKQSAQFAQQITNQVQQIQNQLQMYQNMLQNTATLPTRIWGQAQADLAQLVSLTQQGQSLAYGMSNIDQVFRQRFGTYDSFLGQNITGGSFSQAYSSWSATPRAMRPSRTRRPASRPR